MWVKAEQVVKETEKASLNKKIEVVPGNVYKITRPFLKFDSAINIWKSLTKRNQ